MSTIHARADARGGREVGRVGREAGRVGLRGAGRGVGDGGRGARGSSGAGGTPAETLQELFGYVYTAMTVNISLVVANLPLAIAVVAVPGLFRAWPFALALSLTLTPSLAGAFGAFRALREDAVARPIAAFWLSWRRNLVRASVLGLATTLLVGAVLFNLALIGANPLAPLAAPTLLVVGCGALAITVMSLAGFVTLADAVTADGRPARISAWSIVKASIYLAMRRWYFSLMALALLALAGAAVLAQPVWGTFLAPSILLFGIWSNGHYAFTRLTEQLTA